MEDWQRLSRILVRGIIEIERCVPAESVRIVFRDRRFIPFDIRLRDWSKWESLVITQPLENGTERDIYNSKGGRIGMFEI